MFKGKSTDKLYEACLKKGFCANHQKDLEINCSENYEVQRKAFLYLRLQIVSPLLFQKPFTFDKMRSLFSSVKGFSNRDDPDFHEKILYLDAIVVFTLCHLTKICCLGSMFKLNHPENPIPLDEGPLLDFLQKKCLLETDIDYLVPQLKEHFNEEKESIYRLGFVATMLIVRNVSMTIKIKSAIQQLDKELNSTPKECKSWLEIGSGAHAQQQIAEAIDAYSCGIKYSPYYTPLLLQRAEMFTLTSKYKDAALDCYVILMIEPTSIPALCKYVNALYLMSLYHECLKAIEYGLANCESSCDKQFLISMKFGAEIRIEETEKNIERAMPYQANVEVGKDIPELLEASDSDLSQTETLDVPELMEASNSDNSSSESERTNSTADANKKQTSKKGKVRSPLKDDVEEKVKQMKLFLKEASQKLLEGDDSLALRNYREALDEIKVYPLVHKYKECDIVCIKYAFGISYCKFGGCDNLQRAISTFKGIADEHCSVSFPAAYYGIAVANHKLNRFKEALHYLQIIEDILENGMQVEVYFWPGSTTVIEETKIETLKTLVNDLMKECENPPSPEATCRFHDCSLQPAIYHTDPDFKGFFAIQCSDQCTLQYHPSCWKLLKTEKHFSDKEFLDQNCITPDCEGVIIKIKNIEKDGNLGKVFESADSKKSTKKKTKLEKKLEVKEVKKRKRKDSSSKTEVVSETSPESTNENQPPSETQPDSNKSDIKTEVKEKIEGPSNSNETQISANAELYTVLKKEKLIDENVSKSNSKVKEHKKTRNTLSIDEFLEHTDTYSSTNEYQQRLNVLRQNKQQAAKGLNHNMKPTAPCFEPRVPEPTTPSFEPRVLDFTHVETSYGLDDFPQMPSPTPTSIATYDTNSTVVVESTSSTFNPSMLPPPEFSIECAKKNIYSYLKNILCKHGPLREDDPILIRELQGFPGEANALIADCGGLGKFLQQSVDFAFVGDTYVCTVDQLTKAYEKINTAHIPLSPSECSEGKVDPYLNFNFQDYQEDYTAALEYCLNPDAQEYSPFQIMGRNSPQLISAISKLRQPLILDEESTRESSLGLDQNTARDNYSLSLPNSVPHLASGDATKPPTRLQLARKCAEAVKVYFSPEANEFRSYIRQFLQPFAIVEVSKKSNVLVQTENDEKEILLKNTTKADEELQRLKEVVNCLTEENVSLKEQNELLGEQCSSALDNFTKLQRKTAVELQNLKKELEDVSLDLEEQKKESKSKESRLEKEIKVLSESLKKSKEEQSTQKSEMEMTHENLKMSLEKAEERIKLLRNEKHILKTTLDIQIDKLKSDMVNALKRAEAAELTLLLVKKTEYLKRIDSKAAEAVKRVKELEEGMSVANLNPVFVKNFGALLSQIRNYIAKLGAVRIEFSTNIDEQINSIKNGTPLEKLQSLEMKELPEIPSWTTQLPTQNGLPPNEQTTSWISQVHNLNSFNPNMASAYLSPPTACPPTPTLMGMQANPQAYLLGLMNPSNINRGAIPKTSVNLTIPTASTSQNPKKLPPGLPDPVSNYKTAPEVAQPAKQSTAAVSKASPSRQPVVSQSSASMLQPISATLLSKEETNLKARSVSSSSGLDSFGTSPISSATSKASLDAKKACDNYDSLELDYNVKVTPAQKKPKVPESTAASSSKSVSQNNSYEKLIQKLKVVYPEATQAQMAAIIKDYRSQKSKLSGMTVDMIVNEIIAMVAKKKDESKRLETAQKNRMVPSKPLVNKKLASDNNMSKVAEQNGNSKKFAWGVGDDSSRQWHGKDIDEPCTICFEEMTLHTAYKVDCGHTFHLNCIKEWMNKKSDCPICRVHLLLPEDYPAL